jgi:hypothetical protein
MQVWVKEKKNMWGQSPLYYVLQGHLIRSSPQCPRFHIKHELQDILVQLEKETKLFPWNLNALILFKHSKCFANHFMGGAHHQYFVPMLYVL